MNSKSALIFLNILGINPWKFWAIHPDDSGLVGLVMGDLPDKAWGVAEYAIPPSFMDLNTSTYNQTL